MGVHTGVCAETPDSQPASAALGKRIYLQGLLPSGKSISARLKGGTRVRDARFACVQCHRRSALGGSEGGRRIPAITAQALFSPRVNERHLRARSEQAPAVLRSAYDDAGVGRAITQGIDADGHTLDDLMPRFELSEQNLAHLVAYLRTSSRHPPPGLDEQQIHFAAVVAGDVDAAQVQAMQAVIEAFVHDKNANTRNETGRSRRPPWHKQPHYTAYRKWVFHLWPLSGPPTQWPQQLEQYYAKTPVFALIGGTGSASWQPIHAFCAAHELPCVLPSTDLPVTEQEDFYALYFSQGMRLEARALAAHLHKYNPKAQRVLQVVQAGARAKQAARSLRQALASREGMHIEDSNYPLDKAALESKIQHFQPEVVVLWLDANELKTLPPAVAALGDHGSIYFSASLNAGEPPQALLQNPAQRFLLQPFDKHNSALLRIQTWLERKNIRSTHERIQADTFTALSLSADALNHLNGYYSQAFFLETLEHMLDNSVTSSVYPHLSLGPGQRFASKGCYVVELRSDNNNNTLTDAQWLIP